MTSQLRIYLQLLGSLMVGVGEKRAVLKNAVAGRIPLRSLFIEGRKRVIKIRDQLGVNPTVKTFLQETASILLHLDQLLPEAVSVRDDHIFVNGKLELEHPAALDRKE